LVPILYGLAFRPGRDKCHPCLYFLDRGMITRLGTFAKFKGVWLLFIQKRPTLFYAPDAASRYRHLYQAQAAAISRS
jgi:hypothetical protein